MTTTHESVTIFLLVSCLISLIKEPRKYWDGALSWLAHGGLIALLWASAAWRQLTSLDTAVLS